MLVASVVRDRDFASPCLAWTHAGIMTFAMLVRICLCIGNVATAQVPKCNKHWMPFVHVPFRFATSAICNYMQLFQLNQWAIKSHAKGRNVCDNFLGMVVGSSLVCHTSKSPNPRQKAQKFQGRV